MENVNKGMWHLPCSLWPWSCPSWRWIPSQYTRTQAWIRVQWWQFSFPSNWLYFITCSQALWGTQQHCCCKQCHSNFSPLCSFGSSLAVPHIWLFGVGEKLPKNLAKPELPGNPWVWVQAVTDPQGQGNRARSPDAENHLLLLELLLASVNIVAESSESMIQVLHMRVQNRTLSKYQIINIIDLRTKDRSSKCWDALNGKHF